MTTKITYQVELTGTETAAEQLAALNTAIAKTQESVGSKTLFDKASIKAADDLGNAFKSVSRDVDVLGGQIAATTMNAASDVLGLVSAFGIGGLAGGIAVAGAAIGGTIKLWDLYTTKAQRAAEEQTKALKSASDWASGWAKMYADGTAAATAQSLALSAATLKARALVDAQMILEEGVIRARIASLSWYHTEDVRRIEEGEADKIAAKRKEFNLQTEEIQKEHTEDKKVFLVKEATDREEKVKKEWDDKHKANEKKKNEDIERYRKDIAKTREKAEEDEMNARFKRNALLIKANTERIAEEKKGAAETIKAESELWKSWGGAIESLEEADSRLRMEQDARISKSTAVFIESSVQKIEASKKAKAAFTEEREALAAVHMEQQYGASVNLAYGLSTMVMAEMMKPVISMLEVYGTLNRENWRDLLQFTEDSKAAFVAQVQTALWSIAMQSGQKVPFEIAEGYKELALSAGDAASLNFTGASMHAMAGQMHFVAANAYGTLAGVSAGASVGVGMTRGSGGLVGLTKEERGETKNMDGSGSGGSSAGAPKTQQIGGGQSSGPVVVNFVYEAGAINAQNRDAAAATVASATRHARRDGFRRREMGG